MEQANAESEIVLYKFISKARKKLNHSPEKEPSNLSEPKHPQAEYIYSVSERGKYLSNLEKRVIAMLKKDPNTTSPIGNLIDHSVYDSLSESSKSRYILNLSSDYNKVLERIKNKI